ncbi:MAG: hypothetical protein HY271_02995 [Deltaproteobacteria bacterium]|nr:hypothetical protein [Deltaproteobacteria bacterium]
MTVTTAARRHKEQQRKQHRWTSPSHKWPIRLGSAQPIFGYHLDLVCSVHWYFHQTSTKPPAGTDTLTLLPGVNVEPGLFVQLTQIAWLALKPLGTVVATVCDPWAKFV